MFDRNYFASLPARQQQAITSYFKVLTATHMDFFHAMQDAGARFDDALKVSLSALIVEAATDIATAEDLQLLTREHWRTKVIEALEAAVERSHAKARAGAS